MVQRPLQPASASQTRARALAPLWWIAPLAVIAIGLGFYMLHNTLQTNATQMSPQARGTAIFIIAALLLPILGIWFAAQLRRSA